MAIVQIEGKARAKFLKKKQWIVWEEKEVQSNGKYVLLKKLKVEEKCLYGLWVKKVLKEEIGNWKKSVSFDCMKIKNFYKSKNFWGLSLLFSTQRLTSINYNTENHRLPASWLYWPMGGTIKKSEGSSSMIPVPVGFQ